VGEAAVPAGVVDGATMHLWRAPATKSSMVSRAVNVDGNAIGMALRRKNRSLRNRPSDT
jgi:hypothetical protein